MLATVGNMMRTKLETLGGSEGIAAGIENFCKQEADSKRTLLSVIC